MKSYIFFAQISLILLLSLLAQAQPPKQLWVARYDGPANSSDRVSALAIDGSGNVYVTGSSYGSGTYSDYATIKYDPNGNELWVARYNGPANGYDSANALVIDDSGNVYVAGSSVGIDYDYATIKYDPGGNQLWVARYDGPANSTDEARDLAIDSLGNVYVTGWSIDIGYDYATIKYDPNGNQLWVARYNRDPENSDDIAEALSVDDSGNVYVTGWNNYLDTGSGQYDSDYVTVKYDSNGNQLWERYYEYDHYEYSQDFAKAIAVSDNVVYVTGFCRDESGNLIDDYMTIAYDSSGNELWKAHYNGLGNSQNEAKALITDDLGNVYVTGSGGTIKYDSTGNPLWAGTYGGVGLTTDDSGNAYVTGRSDGNGTGYDYATIKYDPNGNQLWVARYDGPANSTDEARALAIDSLGNVYVTGDSYGGSSTSYDYATIKYRQCLGQIAGDINDDCKVDFVDFAILAGDWLECNFALEEDCW